MIITLPPLVKELADAISLREDGSAVPALYDLLTELGVHEGHWVMHKLSGLFPTTPIEIIHHKLEKYSLLNNTLKETCGMISIFRVYDTEKNLFFGGQSRNWGS